MKNDITTMLTAAQSFGAASDSVAAVRLRLATIVHAFSGSAAWSPLAC